MKTQRRVLGWWTRLFTLKEEKPKMVFYLCVCVSDLHGPKFGALALARPALVWPAARPTARWLGTETARAQPDRKGRKESRLFNQVLD